MGAHGKVTCHTDYQYGFVGTKRHEGVRIKAWGGLQSTHKIQIRKKRYFQVYMDIFLTDIKENTDSFQFLLVKCRLCKLWQRVKYEIHFPRFVAT